MGWESSSATNVAFAVTRLAFLIPPLVGREPISILKEIYDNVASVSK